MPRRILEGQVVSDKQDKTVTVLVERRFMHPVYKKYLKSTSKYAAHDEANAFKEGDRVQIEECRPISKRKTWRVITTPAGGTAPAKTEEKAKAPAKKEEAQKAEPKKAEEKAKKPAAKKAADEKPAAKKETTAKAKTASAAKKKTTAKKKDEK